MLSFEKGEPVAINGEKYGAVDLLTKLNYIGGEHEGKTGASRTIVVVCADSTWKLASSTEEPPQ